MSQENVEIVRPPSRRGPRAVDRQRDRCLRGGMAPRAMIVRGLAARSMPSWRYGSEGHDRSRAGEVGRSERHDARGDRCETSRPREYPNGRPPTAFHVADPTLAAPCDVATGRPSRLRDRRRRCGQPSYRTDPIRGESKTGPKRRGSLLYGLSSACADEGDRHGADAARDSALTSNSLRGRLPAGRRDRDLPSS